MIVSLLDEREAATLLRTRRCTVRNERVRGKLGFVHVGRRILYTPEQLREYLQNRGGNA